MNFNAVEVAQPTTGETHGLKKTIIHITQTPSLVLSTTPTCPDRSPNDPAHPHLVIFPPARWRASRRHHRGWAWDLHWGGCG